MKHNLIRIVIGLISGFASFNGFALSLKEWASTGACPSIYSVPACYVVTAAYFLIFLSALTNKETLYKRLFVAGAAIVFGLALIGSFMQVTSLGQCPKTASGFPMCYTSLMISTALIALFIARLKTKKPTKK